MHKSTPSDGTRPVLRYRRLDIGPRFAYRWDWALPNSGHESVRLFRTRWAARLSVWWFLRSIAKADEHGGDVPADSTPGFKAA